MYRGTQWIDCTNHRIIHIIECNPKIYASLNLPANRVSDILLQYCALILSTNMCI